MGILASSTAALATTPIPPVEEMEMSTVEESTPAYISVTGTITANAEFVNIVDGDNEYDLVITENTLIYNNKGEKLTQDALTADTKISAYVNANEPAVLVMPPRYTPTVVIVETEDFGFVTVDTFYTAQDTLQLTSTQNTLRLSLEEETKIVDRNGNTFAGDLEGKDLAVFYTMSTRSLPPQTTPDLVIVLDEEVTQKSFDPDMIYNKVIVNGKEITIGTDDAAITGMVPVRAVAETLGYTVAWDQGLQAVSVGTVPMGINFNIGENAYNKARMMPFVLSKAPIKIAVDDPRYGVTFVPVDFFTEVLGATAWSEGDVLYIEAETPDFDVEA